MATDQPQPDPEKIPGYQGKPGATKPSIQVGREGSKVVLAINGTPIAYMSAPEASTLMAMLCKHACVISAGLKLVDKAMDDSKVEPPIVIPDFRPPPQFLKPPPPPSSN